MPMTPPVTPTRKEPDATFAPEISSSPEPGPSRQHSLRAQSPSIHATTSRESDTERAQIEDALHSKRRKSSLIPGVHFGRLAHGHSDGTGTGSRRGTIKGRKRADTGGSDYSHYGEGDYGSPQQALAPKSGTGTGTGGVSGNGGPTVPDITDHNETDEGRELEAEIERLNREALEARGRGKPAILFQKDKEPWDDYDPESEEQYPPREYVWDGESFSPIGRL